MYPFFDLWFWLNFYLHCYFSETTRAILLWKFHLLYRTIVQGSRPSLISLVLFAVEDLTGVKVEEDQADIDLQVALDKARKLKQKKDRKNPDKVGTCDLLARLFSEKTQGIAVALASPALSSSLLSSLPLCKNLDIV